MGTLDKTVYRQASPPIAEKRRCPRYPFCSAAEALDLEGDTRIFGRLADIARHGCYMDTISPFAKNAAVRLTISKDRQTFQTEAKVVYSMIGMGMGLFFTAAEPEQLRVLGGWLEELSGERQVKQTDKLPQNLILQPEPAKRSDHEVRTVLSELIALLNGKSVLNDSEGMALLRKLSK
jgi:PilZ domain-containing protein